MITFEATIELRVSGPNRSEHFQHVVDAYYAIEQADESLLDAAWSFADGDEHADVEVELTLRGDSEDTAYKAAACAVRAAIHAAGGFTPDWDDRPDPHTPVYRLDDIEIELVPA